MLKLAVIGSHNPHRKGRFHALYRRLTLTDYATLATTFLLASRSYYRSSIRYLVGCRPADIGVEIRFQASHTNPIVLAPRLYYRRRLGTFD